MNVFSLKQVTSALMIAVNLLYFSSIHHFLFTCIFNESIYDALMPLKKKKLWATCTFFLFCFVHFKFYCFDYNGLKKALFCKQSQLFATNFFFFHKDLIYVYLKKASCTVCGEVWVWVWHYISQTCLHLLFCFTNLH